MSQAIAERTPLTEKFVKATAKPKGGENDARFAAAVNHFQELTPAEQHRFRGVFGTPEAKKYHREVFGDVLTPATLKGFNQWLKDCVTEGHPKFKGVVPPKKREFYAGLLQHYRTFFDKSFYFQGSGDHFRDECVVSTKKNGKNRRFSLELTAEPRSDIWPLVQFPPLSCG